MNAKSKRARLLSSVVAVTLSAGVLFSFAAGASAYDKDNAAQPSSSVSPAAGDKAATASDNAADKTATDKAAAGSGATQTPAVTTLLGGGTDGGPSAGLTESFMNSTVGDNTWQALGDACLTAAAQVMNDPGSGKRDLGGCYHIHDTGDLPRADSNFLIGQPNGFLQLTDNTGGRVGNVLYNKPLNSADGLDISFTQYQYSKTGSNNGADGIGFFLTDGQYDLTQTGPEGGSFGAAFGYGSIVNLDDKNLLNYPKYPGAPPELQDRRPGLPHAVLGLGLDVYGNFGVQNYVGVNCPALNGFYVKYAGANPTPNTVTLRDGGNGLDGYCVLQTNKVVSGANIKTDPAVPGMKNAPGPLVRIMISPTDANNPYATVTVYINGNLMLQKTLTKKFPPTIKLGFTASTGGVHNVHLIRGFELAKPSLSLQKSVNHDTANGGTAQSAFTVGDTVPYNFKVTNNGNVDLNTVTVTDPKIAAISCPATTLAAGASMTCTGRYGPLSAAEVAAGEFDNTATASGQTSDGTKVPSNPATAKVPMYTNGALSITKTLQGSGASAVDKNQQYAINYSYPAANYQYCSADGAPTTTTDLYGSGDTYQYPAGSGTILVKADGKSYPSGSIPTGATVALSETKPSDSSGVTWQDPVFNPASPVTIGCSNNGSSAVQVVNTANQQLGSATWTKVDDAKTPDQLAGSSWTLTGPGVPANTVVTDCTKTGQCGKGAYDDQNPDPGAFLLNGLAWNYVANPKNPDTEQYTLVEKTAPAGYQRDTTPHTFSKDTVATGQPVNVGQFVNKQAIPPTLPLTGGMSTDAFLIGGSALIVLSAGVAIALRRRSLARMQS
jgi:hypothetical protein